MNAELLEQAMKRREAAAAQPIRQATPHDVIEDAMADRLRMAVPAQHTSWMPYRWAPVRRVQPLETEAPPT